MKHCTHLIVVWLFLVISALAGPADEAAIESIKALYGGDGVRFVRSAHSMRIQELKDEIVRGIERSMDMPNTPREMKDIFGVSTLEELRALAPKEFVRLMINRLPDHKDRTDWPDFAKARFTARESTKVDANTQTVAIDIESDEPKRVLRVEVICKLEGEVWKYWRSSE